MKQYIGTMMPYVIAETAYTFEGDKQYLMNQTNELSTTINAIKYHMMLNLEGYMVKEHSVYDALEQWLLDENDWKDILSRAKDRELDTVVLADDIESVQFCNKYPQLVDAIELHAACINDIDLLNQAIDFTNKHDKVFILGISGFEIQELLDIVEYVKKASVKHIVLMYGFQNYPTDVELINLSKIQALTDILACEIGYADHTEFSSEEKEALVIASFARGSNFQEIHYVLEEGLKRTDYITGIGNDRLIKIKNTLDQVAKGIGKKDFRLNNGEKKYLDFRKVPVYATDVSKGQILTKDDICYKRVEKPERQNKFLEVETLFGKIISKDKTKDSELSMEDFDE